MSKSSNTRFGKGRPRGDTSVAETEESWQDDTNKDGRDEKNLNCAKMKVNTRQRR